MKYRELMDAGKSDLSEIVFSIEELRELRFDASQIALEHETYSRIPGTASSVRVDAANTNTKVQRHAHVYAKLNGGGKQLYSVNADGSGHDGSSGIVVPVKHAEYLRTKGFDVPMNLTLESLKLDDLTDSVAHMYVFFSLQESI